MSNKNDPTNQEYIDKLVARHQRQLEKVRKYNLEHKDELNKLSREYFQKLKLDPERYSKYLEDKKQKYRKNNPIVMLPVKEFV